MTVGEPALGNDLSNQKRAEVSGGKRKRFVDLVSGVSCLEAYLAVGTTDPPCIFHESSSTRSRTMDSNIAEVPREPKPTGASIVAKRCAKLAHGETRGRRWLRMNSEPVGHKRLLLKSDWSRGRPDLRSRN